MDTSGDYLIHTLVRRGKQDLVRYLVEYKPETLHWENATGMIPLEVAFANYSRCLIQNPPRLVDTQHWHVEAVYPWEFVTGGDGDEEKSGRGEEWQMYHLVAALMAKYPGRRKLVGLQEANEVARRLARHQQDKNDKTGRHERFGRNIDDTGAQEASRHKDKSERLDWVYTNVDRWDEMVWRMNEAGEVGIEHEYKDSYCLSEDP